MAKGRYDKIKHVWNAFKRFFRKDEDETAPFERMVSKVTSMSLIGRIAAIPTGLALMSYGLKIWRLLEHNYTVSKLLDENAGNNSVRIGFLFFVVGIAAIISQSDRIALSQLKFLERVEDDIDPSSARELKLLIVSRRLGVTMNYLLNCHFNSFIEWAEKAQKIPPNCVKVVRQAWKSFLGYNE